jgi:hypothetical protein
MGALIWWQGAEDLKITEALEDVRRDHFLLC